jgi:NAD(P)H-flavin reductase
VSEHLDWERAGVRVVLCCSQPGDGWRGARGHVQDVAVATGFGGLPVAGATAFLCGMRAMVTGVRAALEAAGLPQTRTFLNY